MRKLYLTYPKVQTLSGFLSWSHYAEILKSDDPLEISFYAKECEAQKWSVRELKRQKSTALFQRFALSKDKEGILQLSISTTLNTRSAPRETTSPSASFWEQKETVSPYNTHWKASIINSL